MPETRPAASVVIAVYNEGENVDGVAAEVLDVLSGAAAPPFSAFEVVFVDDGSDDSTAARLQALAAADARIRWLRHDRRCGKSAALRTGVAAARGRWIATLDGDGQNDPADLAPMLAAAASSPSSPLVAGVRIRRDDPLSRRVATRFANGLRQTVLNDHCPDTGCGMKVFARDDFLRLPVFEGMHRFLPALFQRYGHALINVPVQHRARRSGHSKYTNWGRALVGVVDLFGVIWLIRRTHAPHGVTQG